MIIFVLSSSKSVIFLVFLMHFFASVISPWSWFNFRWFHFDHQKVSFPLCIQCSFPYFLENTCFSFPFHPFIWSLCRPNSVWRGMWFGVHISGGPVPVPLHFIVNLSWEKIYVITPYTLLSLAYWRYFFLRIFHTRVFTHVICSIDLFSVQGATLSQKKFTFWNILSHLSKSLQPFWK